VSLLLSNTHNALRSSYGLALGFVAARERNDRLLLTAVTQINHGGPKAVIDEEQAVVVAHLNLDAGGKAMDMSDSFSAHSFFDHGISYLRKDHWSEHYDLSLELYNSAAKCALMNAEHDSVKLHTEQIMQNAKCFEDKFQAISVTVTLQNWSGNATAAVELMNSTLTKLEEALPLVVTLAITNLYLFETKAKLAILSDETLMCFPAMVNPSKILAVELLVKLYGSLTAFGERSAMLIIPLKLIQISLSYGMGPHSPSAFAQYSYYLTTIEGNFQEGYRYAKFALSLAKEIPSRAHEGSTIFWSSHTRIYVEPMQSSIECYLDAYEAHMKSGNPYAVASSLVYNNLCLWSGKHLNVVVSSMNDTLKESKYYKNIAVLKLTVPMFRVALRLKGESDAPAPQQDNITDTVGKNNEGDNDGKYATLLHTMFFAKLSEAFIFREFNEARHAVEKYFSIDSLVLLPSVFFFGKL